MTTTMVVSTDMMRAPLMVLNGSGLPYLLNIFTVAKEVSNEVVKTRHYNRVKPTTVRERKTTIQLRHGQSRRICRGRFRFSSVSPQKVPPNKPKTQQALSP